MSTADAQQPAEPFVTVVKGAPTDQELAALVVVLQAARGGGGPAVSKPADRWGAPQDRLRSDWGMPTSYPHRH
ncbi:hypothetical protein GOHSU_12_01260 [Gordonia hirsuta DSM 44140 = NBRC 16056]|uniref:Acyl-CoA carboxylase epsilon subunit n=1 Tax=Gordonia hirsuta DSM 44140 = NBRC 16056 TaxID=1121927 RepID=L7L7J7_9ACTN|nr:acyl-CoA carboxylase subunit epsilon [Gordonia hirsuta]GAC56736.1 hypothetical protein GOHSU_12_01260 [Gordonia hirsuta DSM 44140 = NBRC 16056]